METVAEDALSTLVWAGGTQTMDQNKKNKIKCLKSSNPIVEEDAAVTEYVEITFIDLIYCLSL